ncbi:MAG: hypothetical protein JO368_07890 [Acidimicrobiales bacterium]|nr:hypothetical protein [Acidimicrobiales bacterium]
MVDGLTGELLAPVPAVDEASWRAALADAQSMLADLAVRRGATGPFRVTDHDVRAALSAHGGDPGGAPFAWSTRTARRALGLAAVRSLVAGRARTPVEGVHARVAESSRWVREGTASASQLDRWLAGLPPAALAAVGAEAVTWATRLWCALDWSAFPAPPLLGRDRWWDSPHSALLALRGRADVRTARSHLVVLTGPRRPSVRAELTLVTLVEALRARDGAVPGRVIGWWPDSGHLVRVEPGPSVLRSGAETVALVLAGTGAPVRSAA